MSNLTRMALRYPDNLSNALARRHLGPHAGPELASAPFAFCRVWDSLHTVTDGAQASEAELHHIHLIQDTQDLPAVQRRLTFHSLRLLGLEWRLFAAAQHHRSPGSGRKALRHIELERMRLGRELHTGVGQLLAAILLQLEVIAIELPSPPGKAGQALASISILAAESMELVRAISKRLHPPDWQRLTLETAIRQLWEISGVPQRFQASLHIDPLPCDPHLDVKILIYRGLQEALSNMAQHSQATLVQVALKFRGGQLVLSVRDNGAGFDVRRLFSTSPGAASAIGLRSIREAAEDLGGKLEVESGPDGTTLVVSVAPFPLES